ncbi:hypothetical protein LPB136_09130 [Tenacibaculum todarodis]|uniref:Uncharacterized protein n=1 Tax=Tenacibaculum todarodis TaxID=1850252 RepID=A0A1L3JK36_9FLAO|nr:hypothetical protein [Tenacibaculum todarodis]APG65510.1 hypothetical protein LPB136_09130 [Tenacibaculum todarodis]
MFLKITAIFLFLGMQNNTPDFVSQFHASLTEKEELNYIKKYKDNKSVDVQAYVVSLQMKQAKYKTFPWSKLSVFNKQKKILNKLIKTHPKNVHLRYVRLVIQEKTPKILGYNDHIKEDKTFLKAILKKSDKSDYLDEFIIKNTSL